MRNSIPLTLVLVQYVLEAEASSQLAFRSIAYWHLKKFSSCAIYLVCLNWQNQASGFLQISNL